MSRLRCYDILGLGRCATTAEVRTAYRHSALQCHPDKGGTAEAFRQLVRAFETLCTPESRRLYDAVLRDECSTDGLGRLHSRMSVESDRHRRKRKRARPTVRGEDVVDVSQQVFPSNQHVGTSTTEDVPASNCKTGEGCASRPAAHDLPEQQGRPAFSSSSFKPPQTTSWDDGHAGSSDFDIGGESLAQPSEVHDSATAFDAAANVERLLELCPGEWSEAFKGYADSEIRDMCDHAVQLSKRRKSCSEGGSEHHVTSSTLELGYSGLLSLDFGIVGHDVLLESSDGGCCEEAELLKLCDELHEQEMHDCQAMPCENDLTDQESCCSDGASGEHLCQGESSESGDEVDAVDSNDDQIYHRNGAAIVEDVAVSPEVPVDYRLRGVIKRRRGYAAAVAFHGMNIRSGETRILADAIAYHIILMGIKGAVVGEISTKSAADFDNAVRRAVDSAVEGSAEAGLQMRMYFLLDWRVCRRRVAYIFSKNVNEVLACRRRLLVAKAESLERFMAVAAMIKEEKKLARKQDRNAQSVLHEQRKAQRKRRRLELLQNRKARALEKTQEQRERRSMRLEDRFSHNAEREHRRNCRVMENLQKKNARVQEHIDRNRERKQMQAEDRFSRYVEHAARCRKRRLRRQRIPLLRRTLLAEVRSRQQIAVAAAKKRKSDHREAEARAKAAATAAKKNAAAKAAQASKEKRQLLKIMQQQGYDKIPNGVQYDSGSLKFFAIISSGDGREHSAPHRCSIEDAERDLNCLRAVSHKGPEAIHQMVCELDIQDFMQTHVVPWNS